MDCSVGSVKGSCVYTTIYGCVRRSATTPRVTPEEAQRLITELTALLQESVQVAVDTGPRGALLLVSRHHTAGNMHVVPTRLGCTDARIAHN